MEASSVGVVILSYNDYAQTIECLRSIYKQEDLPRRIMVCDNGSKNEFADKLFLQWCDLAREFNSEEPVEVYAGDTTGAATFLLRLEENEGVSGGINKALCQLLYDQECQAFWVLHNDTKAETFALSALLAHLKDDIENKPIGLIGSTLVYADNGLQECSGGGIWRKWRGKEKLLSSGFNKYAHSDHKEIVAKLDYINGASCFITRELINAIGMFDERFFFFYEDVEYGLRAKQAGFALNWAPGAIVYHKAPHAAELTPVLSLTEEPELTTQFDYLYIRNRFFLIRRERMIAALIALIRLPIPLSWRLYRGQKDRLRLVLRAAYDGLKGRMDKC